MVAIPLEMLLDSGRHIAASLLALGINALGHGARALEHVFRYVTKTISPLYDAYISIPLRFERMLRDSREPGGARSTRRARTVLRKSAAPERSVREEGAA
jgi:hypothetical protein